MPDKATIPAKVTCLSQKIRTIHEIQNAASVVQNTCFPVGPVRNHSSSGTRKIKAASGNSKGGKASVCNAAQPMKATAWPRSRRFRSNQAAINSIHMQENQSLHLRSKFNSNPPPALFEPFPIGRATARPLPYAKYRIDTAISAAYRFSSMKLSLSGLGRFDYVGLFFLRLGTGGLFAYHGFPLFLEGPKAWTKVGRAMELIGVDSLHLILGLTGLMLQAFGGLALVLGLFTRAFALALAFAAALGLAVRHSQDADWLPILVMAQLTLSSLCLAFVGPGRFSLDRRGV